MKEKKYKQNNKTKATTTGFSRDNFLTILFFTSVFLTDVFAIRVVVLTLASFEAVARIGSVTSTPLHATSQANVESVHASVMIHF